MLIELDDITLSLGDDILFDGLSWSMATASCVGIEKGVLDGGSSFLKMLAGLLAPRHGNVAIGQHALYQMTDVDRFRASCMQFEVGGLISLFSNYNNIAFPMLHHTSLSAESIDERIRDLARQLNIDDLLELEPYQLNDVQLRLMNLLRALVFQPKVILLDELQAGMSDEMISDVFAVIDAQQRQQGYGIVMTLVAGDQRHMCHSRYKINNKSLEQTA